jgi:hypothetical protein
LLHSGTIESDIVALTERQIRMMSPTYLLLRQAVLQRAPIEAEYQGLLRQMCPHALGWKNGKEKVLLYQFAGGSKHGLEPPGSPNNWRCLFVGSLTKVRVIDGDWYTASNHSRPQTCIDDVDVQAVVEI